SRRRFSTRSHTPLDALKLARRAPDKQIVFMAIGFETTAPPTALTVLQAAAEGVKNFSVFCNHVTIIPAIKAILESPDLRLDGFILKGAGLRIQNALFLLHSSFSHRGDQPLNGSMSSRKVPSGSLKQKNLAPALLPKRMTTGSDTHSTPSALRRLYSSSRPFVNSAIRAIPV